MQRFLLSLILGFIVIFGVACGGGTGSPTPQGNTVMRGSLIAEANLTLPNDATARIQLVDVSTTANRRVIAENTVNNDTTFPIDWSLTYNPASIPPSAIIAIEATVLDARGNPLFINARQVDVITGGNPSTGIDVEVVAAD